MGVEKTVNDKWMESGFMLIQQVAHLAKYQTLKEMESCGLKPNQAGQTEYIVKKIKEESGYVDAKVVASGGLGKIIAKETDIIDVYDPQLTLKGLRMIYEKNKR